MRINLQLKTLLLSIALCMASRLSAQSPSSTVYAESFRQGTGHVVEETFEARLNLQDATYRERIKDSRGAAHRQEIRRGSRPGTIKSQPGM